MSLTIRSARKSDMDTIAEFIRSSLDWYKPFLAEKDIKEHDVDDQWKEENFRKRDFYLGVNEDDEEVGTISMQYFGDIVYLGYVYLDVKHVGNGYGPQLIDHAKKKALKEGMKKLILISHPEAEWAIKAYERYGFELAHTEREDIMKYEGGILKSYYEEGFALYEYHLESSESKRKIS